MKKIKLLVVDDSILFREVLARYVQKDEQIEIVGTAGDAYSARDMIVKFEPDVMTLDIEMPRMDGIAFLKKLLPQYYIPTLVISSCADRQEEAVSAGAAEFIAKPRTRTTTEMQQFADMVSGSIKRAYTKGNVSRATGKTAKPDIDQIPQLNITHSGNIPQMHIPPKHSEPIKPITPPPSPAQSGMIKNSDIIVALGASTGGTEALEQIIKGFPSDMPPVIVVQHMPAGFTKLYSERLDRSCKVNVKEAEDGDRLRSGLVIIGAGEHHLRLCKDAKGYYISSKKGEKVSGHCPSVDVMFQSVAEVAKSNAIGAIMTGMGKDGANGLLKMKEAGAFTIGQDKETCVVYGMPMEAYKLGAVTVQAPLYRISEIILSKLQ